MGVFYDYYLRWKRIKFQHFLLESDENKKYHEYLVGPVSPIYAAFLYDFQMATKKHFKYLEDELKESSEPVEAKGKENERESVKVEVDAR